MLSSIGLRGRRMLGYIRNTHADWFDFLSLSPFTGISRMTIRRPSLRSVLPLLLLVSHSAAASPRALNLGQWGQLVLELPEGWTASRERRGTDMGATVTIKPGNETPLELLITGFAAPGEAASLAETVYRSVEKAAERASETSTQSSVRIKKFSGAGCQGRYFSATDRTVKEPTPTNFKYMDHGAAVVGRLFMTFTILTNLETSPERAAAFEIVRSARHLDPGPPWRTPDGGILLASSDGEWALGLSLPGYKLAPLELRNDPPGMKLSATHPKSPASVTVFFERAHEGMTASDYREDYWNRIQKMGVTRTDIQRSERGDFAILEFLMPSVAGAPLNQRSLNAFLVRDGVWIDVHISKAAYKPEDKAMFDSILDSLRVVPVPSALE